MILTKFRVEGLPPKKDGAKSMWSKRLESERLVSLRKAALEKMSGHPPLKRDIRLTITVCVGAENNRSVGDLDTFIAGVCDGLMKMAPRCKPRKDIWDRTENSDIHPDIPITIDDDSQIISIQAAKMKDANNKQFYDVTLEGE